MGQGQCHVLPYLSAWGRESSQVWAGVLCALVVPLKTANHTNTPDMAHPATTCHPAAPAPDCRPCPHYTAAQCICSHNRTHPTPPTPHMTHPVLPPFVVQQPLHHLEVPDPTAPITHSCLHSCSYHRTHLPHPCMTHPVLPPLVVQQPLHHLLCKALHAGAVGDRGHEANAALADLAVEVWRRGVAWISGAVIGESVDW